MVNNFVEGVDVDEFFPKLCGEGGPVSQTHPEAQGAGSPHQCPAAGEGHLLCKHHEWLAPALTPLISGRAQLFFLENLGMA